MKAMDEGKLIAEVMCRVGVRLGAKDPIFAVVELNRLALEESVGVLLRQTAPLVDGIRGAGIEMTQQLARLANQRIQGDLEDARQDIARDTQAARQDIASEAHAARHAAAIAIQQVANSHRRGDLASSVCLTIALACALALAAFTAGYFCAPAINDVHCKPVRTQR